MSHYADLSPSELFQRIIRLANEHYDDDELDNYTGGVDYTLQQMQMIINELQNRVDAQNEE